MLILGRVTSGSGGDIILDRARAVIAAEFPELAGDQHPAARREEPACRPVHRSRVASGHRMKLSRDTSEVYVPDGLDAEQALARTTHLAVGAHQDDLEIHGRGADHRLLPAARQVVHRRRRHRRARLSAGGPLRDPTATTTCTASAARSSARRPTSGSTRRRSCSTIRRARSRTARTATPSEDLARGPRRGAAGGRLHAQPRGQARHAHRRRLKTIAALRTAARGAAAASSSSAARCGATSTGCATTTSSCSTSPTTRTCRPRSWACSTRRSPAGSATTSRLPAGGGRTRRTSSRTAPTTRPGSPSGWT